MTTGQPPPPRVGFMSALRRRLDAPALHLATASDDSVRGYVDGIDASIDDLIRLASVSKLYTTVVVARTAAQEGFDLDTPIAEITEVDWINETIPLTSRWLQQLTFAQLLGHTAGFRDVLSDERFLDAVLADPQRRWTPEQLLELSASYGPHLFEPGGGFSYSDTGYVIAGRAIERVTDTPLATLFRTEVFNPAGLSNSYFEPTEDLPTRPARHEANGMDITDMDMSFDWAGGGIVSTVTDLVRFVHYLFTGRLIEPTTLERLKRPEPFATFAPGSSAHYGGYGVGIGRIDLPTGSVYGATGAWGTFAVHDPQRSVSFAGALSNGDLDTHAAIAAIHDHLITTGTRESDSLAR